MRRLLSVAVLLAAATFPVLADERMQHAEWVSEFREGAGEASTRDGSARFGMVCNEDSCRFYYENGIDCEPGINYPIVIATSAGSIAVETVCVPVASATGEVRRYGFGELPQFNDALMQSDSVGIAFPLSNGQFKISQFLMNGYGEATERVLAVMRTRKAEREAREAAERERQAQEAAERARKAQEAAERARQAAEQAAAERARKVAEQEAAERARKAAEQEAMERARKAAEAEAAERARKAAELEATERARLAAEHEVARARALAEQEAAERARKAQEAVSQEVAPAVVETRKFDDSQTAPAQPVQQTTPVSPATVEPTTDALEPATGTSNPGKPEATESPRGNRLPSQF